MRNSAPAPAPPTATFSPPAHVVDGVGGFCESPYATSRVEAAAAHLPDSRLLYWSAFAVFAKTTFGGTNGKTWVGIFDPDTNSITEELVVE